MIRPSPRLPAALAALALLASCGGPVLYIELVVPEIEVTLPQETFPASTEATNVCPGIPGCVFTELDYDFADAMPLVGEDNVEVDLRMTSMAMVLDAGVADLGGVESITIKILNPDDPNDYVVAASYVRTEPNPTSFVVSGNANLDLGRYLDGSTFTARAEMFYDSPTPEFTADVSATFSAIVKLDYGTYVGL